MSAVLHYPNNESITTSNESGPVLTIIPASSNNISDVIADTNDLITNDAVQYIYTINMSIICATCSVLGIITNIINIVVFVRQGFQESINVALMGLTVSDFCSLISLLWTSVCFNPLFMYDADVPLVTLEVQHLTGGWTHVIFTRIISFITAYITLERCLCIAFPLKIKTLLTPNRVAAIITLIYVVMIGTLWGSYYSVQLGWKFVPSRNRTLIGVIFSSDRFLIQSVVYCLNMIYPITAFVGVVVCSSILIWKLNERDRWLRKATIQGEEKTRPLKDRHVVKMVLYVAIVFISTYTPSLLFFLVIAIKKEINMGGVYQNLFILIYSITFTLDTINSSVNIFVYYNMSSNYRRTFRSLFCLGEEKSRTCSN